MAGGLDLLGDRWTLLVIRDLVFFGKRRYAELAASPEGIPTNILAERLRRLVRAGIVERRLYQQRPPRHEYVLGAAGADLEPVLLALVAWGQKHVPGVHRGAAPRPKRR